ncbi:hypothetical protein KB559_07865 [Paenibacillus sp. Marseille-P2973]|uniref:hypothetical protein n=1 Tax=Paenibacillus sp. Marseille-P2973 TaxID=1871032 RepID=UPI001B3971DE|nr:hypothetical protein [Paenibacillus sp. Marseille-P2973]MBQ4898750.1 hypothetical protein [Paenibacillus sp. Marseille-P2973]
MKRVVLVEGIPGSGKSTFARFLANQFERNGHTCNLFFETTYNHPIIHSVSFDDYNMFFESYLDRWNKFLSNQSSGDVVVMESALFQSPIVHLLHKDVNRNLIKSVIVNASELLGDIDCKLIYFYQEDAEAAIHQMIDVRGKEDFLLKKHNEYKHEMYFINRMELGINSHISFFLDYAALANEIVKEVSLETISIENSKQDYSLYEQQLINEFDLEYFPDPYVDITILTKYKGIYYNQDLNFSINIELIDDQLFIFGNKKLKPKDNSQFYLDDMSVTANFIKEGDRVNRVVITEKDLYANRNDNGTVFERIS